MAMLFHIEKNNVRRPSVSFGADIVFLLINSLAKILVCHMAYGGDFRVIGSHSNESGLPLR